MKFYKNTDTLRALYKQHEVLISDGDGGAPEANKPYSMGIFVKDEFGDFEYEPVKRFEGKRFNLKAAKEKAKKYINERLEKRS